MHRLLNTFMTRMGITDSELLIYFNISENTENKTKTHLSKTLLKKVLLRCVWSSGESNSRPLEPHSSALRKTALHPEMCRALLSKRGDKRYYTQNLGVCQLLCNFLFFLASAFSPAKNGIRPYPAPARDADTAL